MLFRATSADRTIKTAMFSNFRIFKFYTDGVDEKRLVPENPNSSRNNIRVQLLSTESRVNEKC